MEVNKTSQSQALATELRSTEQMLQEGRVQAEEEQKHISQALEEKDECKDMPDEIVED